MKRVNKPYKTSDIRFIRENIGMISVDEIARHLNRTTFSIYWKLGQLGLREKADTRNHVVWSDEENKRLLEGVSCFIDWDRVARHVGRTPNACRIRSGNLGLTGVFDFWTEERKHELMTLRKYGWGIQRLARHFRKSHTAIRNAVERFNEKEKKCLHDNAEEMDITAAEVAA